MDRRPQDGLAGTVSKSLKVMLGAETTVNALPVLATPETVTTTLPVVAPVGTVAVMIVALQLMTAAVVLLNLTVLVPCVEPKLVP